MTQVQELLRSRKGILHVAAAVTLIVIVSGVIGLLQIHTLGTIKQVQYMQNGSWSYAYAQACLHEGLLRFRDGTGYTGTTLTFNQGDCEVSIVFDNPVYEFTVTGNAPDAAGHVRTFFAEVDILSTGHTNTLQIDSWEEL